MECRGRDDLVEASGSMLEHLELLSGDVVLEERKCSSNLFRIRRDRVPSGLVWMPKALRGMEWRKFLMDDLLLGKDWRRSGRLIWNSDDVVS